MGADMKCLYCTTELPIDGNTKIVTCPKCGSEFSVTRELKYVSTVMPIVETILEPLQQEDPFFDNTTYH
jgi:hypothetical protein